MGCGGAAEAAPFQDKLKLTHYQNKLKLTHYLHHGLLYTPHWSAT
jgi:hypothetical protein